MQIVPLLFATGFFLLFIEENISQILFYYKARTIDVLINKIVAL